MKFTDAGEHEIMLGFIGNIGWQELLVILLIVLILFGAKRIPELAKGLGSGLREFKKAVKEVDASLNSDGAKAASSNEPPATQTSSSDNKQP